jgi:hypothetical protein
MAWSSGPIVDALRETKRPTRNSRAFDYHRSVEPNYGVVVESVVPVVSASSALSASSVSAGVVEVEGGVVVVVGLDSQPTKDSEQKSAIKIKNRFIVSSLSHK